MNSKNGGFDKFALLSSVYHLLAEELEYANTPYRNQPKYFKKLYTNYKNADEKKKANKIYILAEQLEKLNRTAGFSYVSVRDIIKKLNFDSWSPQYSYLESILGYSNLPVNIAMKKIIDEYDLQRRIKLSREENKRKELEKQKEEEKKKQEDEEKKKQEDERQKTIENNRNTSFEQNDGTEITHNNYKRRTNSATLNETNNMTSAKQIYRQINKKRNSYTFNNLSSDIKNIIDTLVRLRKDSRLNMTELAIKWRKEALKELICLHTVLKAKKGNELSDDEKIILELLSFSKYNPLNILKNYERKHPEYFSYSKILDEVKEMIQEYTNQLQSHGVRHNSVIFNNNKNDSRNKNMSSVNLHDFYERELYVKKIKKYINRNKDFSHYEFDELSFDCAYLIRRLTEIKFLSINDNTEDSKIKDLNDSHVELIYKYIILSSKNYNDLTDEEKVLLNLFGSKYLNPLYILKQNGKKNPEHFSYQHIIDEVNEKLSYDIEKMLEDRYVSWEYTKHLSSEISGMTSLMNLNEITVLYKKLVNKDLIHNGEGMRSYYLYNSPKRYFSQLEAFQHIFVKAIRSNPNYNGFSTEGMSDEQISNFRLVENMFICAKYFHHLPAYNFINSKEELCTYIMEHCPSEEVAIAMCNEIMNIEYLYDEHHQALASTSVDNKNKKM